MIVMPISYESTLTTINGTFFFKIFEKTNVVGSELVGLSWLDCTVPGWVYQEAWVCVGHSLW